MTPYLKCFARRLLFRFENQIDNIGTLEKRLSKFLNVFGLQFIDNVIEVFRIVRIHTTDIIRSNTIHPIAVVVFGLFVVFLHIGDHFIHFFRSRSFFHDFIQFGINQRFQMLCLVRITIEAHRHAIVGVRLAYRTGLNTYTVSSSFFFPDIFGIS